MTAKPSHDELTDGREALIVIQDQLFAYARNGAAIEVDAKKAAKAELAEMLDLLARQIRQ